MLCSKCFEYVDDHHSHCPYCGSGLPAKNEDKSQKPKFYCTRCKRQLLSKICPIHGIDATIVITPAAWPAGAGQDGRRSDRIPSREGPHTLLPAKQKPEAPQNNGDLRTSSSRVHELKELFHSTSPDNSTALPRTNAPQNRESNLPDTARQNHTVISASAAAAGVSPHPVSASPVRDDEIMQPSRQKSNGQVHPKLKPQKDDFPSRESLNELIERKFTSSNPRQKPGETPGNGAPNGKPANGKPSNSPGERRKHKMPRRAPGVIGSKKKPNYKTTILVVVSILVLVAAGYLLYNRYYPVYLRDSLYRQAEKLYGNGQYKESLSIFQDYKKRYPQSSSISLVEHRIEQIENIEKERKESQGEIKSLMKLATAAFSDQRYLSPRNDNAAYYLRQVLNRDSEFSLALKLQEQMVRFYFQRAENALNRGRYEEAITGYQNILAIKPNDAETLDRIDLALKQKNVLESLDKVTRLSDAEAELKKLQREKFKLEARLQQERKTLNKMSPTPSNGSSRTPITDMITKTISRPASNPASSTAQESTGLDKPAPAPAEEIEKTLGIELAPDAAAAQIKEKENVKLVEETLIDGGKKEYIHREKPELPPDVQQKETAMILAECIIGTDGNVEDVTIVSPADNEQLNRLALNSFKKYRFKPATYKGDPVKFKSLEVMAFSN